MKALTDKQHEKGKNLTTAWSVCRRVLHLEKAGLDRIHDEQLHLIEGHEGDHVGEGRDTHGGVRLRQLLQQPQDRHLLNGLGILPQVALLHGIHAVPVGN